MIDSSGTLLPKWRWMIDRGLRRGLGHGEGTVSWQLAGWLAGGVGAEPETGLTAC